MARGYVVLAEAIVDGMRYAEGLRAMSVPRVPEADGWTGHPDINGTIVSVTRQYPRRTAKKTGHRYSWPHSEVVIETCWEYLPSYMPAWIAEQTSFWQPEEVTVITEEVA